MLRFLGRFRALAAGLFLLPVFLTGCGGEQRGTVTGKVLFDGKPLGGGQVTVTFVGETGKVGHGKVDPEGKYMVEIVPGNTKIIISVPEFRTLAGGRVREMDPSKFGAKGSVVKAEERNKALPHIPAKYGDPKQTPLSYTVKPGSQEHNIEIKKQ